MRLSHQLLSAASIFALSSTALAASPEEASQIKAAIEKYLTAEPGVVTVSVAGDAYDLTIDVGPFIAKSKQPNITAKVSPLVFKIKPQGGGKWQVGQDQSMSVELKGGPAFAIDYRINGMKFTGIFDEAMSGFASNNYEVANFEAVQSITDPTSNTKQLTKSKVEAFKGQTASTLNATGGIDFTGRYEAASTVSDSKIESPSGPFSFAYATGKNLSTYAGTNFRQREFLALIAWFVARPSPEAIKKDQNELRALVKSALPLFDTLTASGEASKIAVTTQIGNGGLSHLGFNIDLNGVTKDGKVREAVNLSGITLPEGILPPWSKPLLPTDASLDFTISGFNAADAAALMVDNLDLNAEPPLKPEVQMQLLGKALPTGAMQIALNPGSIKSASYEITYDGAFNVVLAGLPSGKGTVKMKGFEQTIQALQQTATTDPSVNQIIGPLMAARGFSKQDGDALVWAIESTPQGGILVNGIDITKMGAP